MPATPSFRLACDVGFDVALPAPAAGDLDELRVRTLVAVAMHEAGAHPDEDVEVGVTFVDEGRIAELNAEHREMAGATDVLAFPIDGLVDPVVPPGAPRQLGDVVVCVAYVERQLAEGATMLPHGPGQVGGDATLAQALERCVVHGVLHLAGFDHERGDVDAREMFALEQLVLDRVREATR